MSTQSFESHAYHPIPTYFAGAFTLTAIITLIGAWVAGWGTLYVGLVSLAFAVAVLAAISRWYIVRLQDRIIMLEMKVRCAEVLRPEQEALLGQLGPKQIVALRFASDAELGELLERATREQLVPKEIKRAVKQWRPDDHRT